MFSILDNYKFIENDAEKEIIKTLMGEQQVDYVVKPRFLQQKRDEKRGTDMRKQTKINLDLENQVVEEKSKKKKKSKKGITFGDTEVAVIGEDGAVEKVEKVEKQGMLKHRRKKKKNDAMDEKEMAEIKAKKRAKTMADVTKAMRKRTLEVKNTFESRN